MGKHRRTGRFELTHVFTIAYIIGLVWLLGWEVAAFVTNKTLLGLQVNTMSDLTWRWAQIPAWTWQRCAVLATGTVLTLHMGMKWFH